MNSSIYKVMMLACVVTLNSACSIYQITGDTMVGYSAEHMIPYLLKRGDTDAVCATGLGLGNFLLSFGEVTDPPHKARVVTQLSASTCAEVKVWEAELRYQRALKVSDAIAMRDADIVQKRAHQTTAARLYFAYQGVEAAFGELKSGQCPELKSEWDQLVWLLGMLSAVQSLQHDRAAKGANDVPMDLPARAARGVTCLDNQRWWGVPQAIKAAVWIAVPGSAPEGADPNAELQSAIAIGDKSGVRLARAVALKTLANANQTAALKAGITAYQESFEAVKSAPRWRSLDMMARLQIQHMSDVIWTGLKGHRTPFGELGTFPEPEGDGGSESDTSADDDLLD